MRKILLETPAYVLLAGFRTATKKLQFFNGDSIESFHFFFVTMTNCAVAVAIGREGSDVFSYYENTALQAN